MKRKEWGKGNWKKKGEITQKKKKKKKKEDRKYFSVCLDVEEKRKERKGRKITKLSINDEDIKIIS